MRSISHQEKREPKSEERILRINDGSVHFVKESALNEQTQVDVKKSLEKPRLDNEPRDTRTHH
jgi:hypothetical protein